MLSTAITQCPYKHHAEATLQDVDGRLSGLRHQFGNWGSASLPLCNGKPVAGIGPVLCRAALYHFSVYASIFKPRPGGTRCRPRVLRGVLGARAIREQAGRD